MTKTSDKKELFNAIEQLHKSHGKIYSLIKVLLDEQPSKVLDDITLKINVGSKVDDSLNIWVSEVLDKCNVEERIETFINTRSGWETILELSPINADMVAWFILFIYDEFRGIRDYRIYLYDPYKKTWKVYVFFDIGQDKQGDG